MSKIESLYQFPKVGKDQAQTAQSLQHVFIRDLVLNAAIGAYESEKGRHQRIRINVHMTVAASDTEHEDRLENVVCYDSMVAEIKSILASGHIDLVETLAGKIADAALQDQRIESVRVRVEKLDAIREAASVGVEIERRRNRP